MGSTTYEAIKKAGGLPTPSGAALKLLTLASKEETTTEELAAVVQADPGLAARLLKLVNSPLAGKYRTIASLHQAIALLGFRAVKDVALGFSLLDDHRNGACEVFDYEAFWSTSVARAVTARIITAQLKSFAPDEAFTCGLLCQIGRLALATAFPTPYASVLRSQLSSERQPPAKDPDGAKSPEAQTSLEAVEQDTFAINHNVLAGEMMADWGLAGVFCDAVRNQDKPDLAGSSLEPRTAHLGGVLYLGGKVATLLTDSPNHPDDFPPMTQAANRVGLDPCAFSDVFDTIREEWRHIGQILNVKTQRVAPLIELRAEAIRGR